MSEDSAPQPPTRQEPTGWAHFELWGRVREAVLALPGYFSTPTVIEGMRVTDIFTLNSALGATIEEQVVKTLNGMRPVWDPDKKYQAYSFVRQPQVFPDVLLRKKTNGQDILMGIELKGWYILSKERMPNFRFTQSADASNAWDLIVVVPPPGRCRAPRSGRTSGWTASAGARTCPRAPGPRPRPSGTRGG